MDERTLFLKLIKEMKWTLIRHYLFRFLQYALFFSAATIFLLAMLGRVLIITNIAGWMILLSLMVVASVSYFWYKNRPTNKTAIQIFDESVKENRVLTTFSFLNDSREISLHQREDTVKRMKQKKETIVKSQKLTFHWKELSATFLLLIGTITSFIYPSEPMLAASNLKTNKELVKELEEELESVDEPVDEELKEILDSLKEQLKDIESAELALEELLHTESELEEMKLELLEKNQELESIVEQLSDSGLNELMDALKDLNKSALQDALKNVQEQMDDLTEVEKETLVKLMEHLMNDEISSLDELTKDELEELLQQLEEQLTELMEASLNLEALQKLQEQLQQAANSINTNMGNAGLSNHPSLSFAGNNHGSGQQGQGEGEGEGQEPGNSNSGNGNGSEPNGNGSGTGQSPGSGSGTGTGGNSSGSGGQGAGTGQGPRELVTIPERITGEENMEVDDGELGSGNGERQQSETAPVLRGTVRPYQEVIGNYESIYRESMERLQLPRHLEGIVRDYFSELNLEQE